MTFLELVKEQIIFGGIKYRGVENGKESTDVIFDIFGHEWLLGTIYKYILRYGNLGREKDLLKIGAYLYIIWLKRGFYLGEEGSDSVIDITIEIKDANFDIFKSRLAGLNISNSEISYVKETLILWSTLEFKEIDELNILTCFDIVSTFWSEVWGENGGYDTDTKI